MEKSRQKGWPGKLNNRQDYDRGSNAYWNTVRRLSVYFGGFFSNIKGNLTSFIE